MGGQHTIGPRQGAGQLAGDVERGRPGLACCDTVAAIACTGPWLQELAGARARSFRALGACAYEQW